MVKNTKFIILAAGIVGLLGFFLPFISYTVDGQSVSLSASTLIGGAEAVSEAVSGSDVAPAASAEVSDAVGKFKAFLYAIYAPALILALFGGIAVKRKRFGRGFGAMSLILGLLTMGVWMLMNGAAGESEGASMGIGFQLLLVTGLGGLVGGLVALVKPDRGDASPRFRREHTPVPA